jgi:hypothetical protein
LFTDVTTITAASQTDVVSETIAGTVLVTVTVAQSAAPVTTTAFVYPQTFKARRVESPEAIPEYATAA